jgi:hypothetical protein
VQRGDSRHGRTIDDSMSAEARHLQPTNSSRSDGWRDPEIPGEDEPGGQPDDSPLRGGTPVGMTPDDVEGRFRMARFFETGEFPADADEIRTMVAEAHAPDSVIEELDRLPDGRYETVTEVWKALGHGVEVSRPDMESPGGGG